MFFFLSSRATAIRQRCCQHTHLHDKILHECGLPTALSSISLFSLRLCRKSLLLSCHVFDSVVSHGDKDVQVEAVVRLPEEEDEDEAEETGAGETPVQPRQLWIKGQTERDRETCSG